MTTCSGRTSIAMVLREPPLTTIVGLVCNARGVHARAAARRDGSHRGRVPTLETVDDIEQSLLDELGNGNVPEEVSTS